MPTLTYATRRGELLQYFDRTAVDAWKRLTSDAPVNSIRATVRAGRDDMRRTLLGWLPHDLHGARILDAGCGTGALSVEAARRGAHVVAIDLSPTLVALARERLPRCSCSIDFHVGDMLDPALGRFDYVVAMDSLIHYRPHDTVRVLDGLAQRTAQSLLFTFAPRTPALSVDACGRPAVPARRPRAGDRTGSAADHAAPDRQPILPAGRRTAPIGSPAASIFPRRWRSSASERDRNKARADLDACRHAVHAVRRRRDAGTAAGAAAAAVAVPGLGRAGRGAADRHAQPRHDRGAWRAGLAGRGDDLAAAGVRAVPGADRVPFRYA